MYVGIYAEILEVEEKSLDDANVKLYYDFEKQLVRNVNKIWQYHITGTALNHTVDIEQGLLSFSSSYKIAGYDLDKIKLYPIVYDNNTYQVLDKEYVELTLETNVYKKATMQKIYKYQKKDYELIATIQIMKEEV